MIPGGKKWKQILLRLLHSKCNIFKCCTILISTFCYFQERQQLKKNGPQLPVRIQSNESTSSENSIKLEPKKITNELPPQKKKAPPPPPNVVSLIK